MLALRLQQLEATASPYRVGSCHCEFGLIERLEGNRGRYHFSLTRTEFRFRRRHKPSGSLVCQEPNVCGFIGQADLNDYLRQAGGITEDANKREMYRHAGKWTTDSSSPAKEMRPGDTIVVPQNRGAPPSSVVADGGQRLSAVLTAAGIAVVGR